MGWKDKLDNRLYNDTILNDAIDNFSEYLMNAINTFDVNINHSVSTIKMTIQSPSALDKANEIMMGLTLISDIVNTGDVITWNNIDWITISKDNKTIDNCNKVYIQKSNNNLLFYSLTPPQSPSPITNDPYQIPCIVGKGNISLDTNKFLSIPADENLVVCPNNIDSSKIDENTRFILGGKVYSVIGIDNIETVGLLVIRIKEGQISDDDNLELGIANYYSNQIIREIYILNGTEASLLYTNATLQLNLLCKDNGVIVDNPTVTYSTSSAYVCSISSSGLITANGTGDAIVTAYYGAVSASITIHSEMVISDNYNIVITPTDTTLKLSRSLVLVAKSMNNGVDDLIPRIFVWSISNLDGSSNNYASINVDGEICTILASSLSSVANKYVVVRCELSYDPNIFIERQIKIINLF